VIIKPIRDKKAGE
jgi:hypothetical protein